MAPLNERVVVFLADPDALRVVLDRGTAGDVWHVSASLGWPVAEGVLYGEEPLYTSDDLLPVGLEDSGWCMEENL